jgi:membrane protein
MAALALTTVGQAFALLRAAGETLGVSGLMDRAISIVGPLAVLFLGLLFLYKVMPNAQVKSRSAAVGALIGGLLWYVVLIVHVRFQVGVARFNALYSSFAAFPIFLAWQHISWLVVLVGAQIARRARSANADQTFKEMLCLSAMLEVARAFTRGTPHPTREWLSSRLDAPEELIAKLLDPLVASGILVEVNAAKSDAYALDKSPELIHVKDLLDAQRRSPEFGSQRAEGLDPTAKRLWLELDGVMERADANCSLRELVEAEDAARDTAAAK